MYAGWLLLLLAVVLDRPLTRTMSLHMLVHIPLILFSGLCFARAWVLRDRDAWAWLSGFNGHGLAGLLFFNLVGAYWMIPKALDEVLLSWPAALSKYVSVLIAGWVLYHSLRRANIVIQVFFIGNFCWMTAIVGLLYRDNPVRLCNFYLLDDQEIAGNGLVALSILLPAIWFWVWRRRIWDFLR
ncbi:hypothetical protein ERE07_14830 [Allopusillimonas ginsengisoli]|nr:hypothetical protein ERE07_14830 [Allopusillimonas ginsengisoli]